MGVSRLLTIGLAAAALAAPPASAASLHGSLRYGKNGGFAGVVERVTIKPDGSGFTKDGDRRRNFKLSENRLGLLERRVTQADLRHTRSPKQRVGGHVADGIGLFVSYYGHTISWGDDTNDPPSAVSRLATLLDEIFTQYRPSS